MDKIRINMLSQATSVDGQGVGSAYIEQVALVKENDDIFEVAINSRKSDFDIYHMHTFNPQYVMRLNKRHINVTYVHCLPTTFDGSLTLLLHDIEDRTCDMARRRNHERVVCRLVHRYCATGIRRHLEGEAPLEGGNGLVCPEVEANVRLFGV